MSEAFYCLMFELIVCYLLLEQSVKNSKFFWQLKQIFVGIYTKIPNTINLQIVIGASIKKPHNLKRI